MAIARSSNFVRFSIFEVDLRAGELLKQGVKIKLPEQSFQILAMLLEQARESWLRARRFRRGYGPMTPS